MLCDVKRCQDQANQWHNVVFKQLDTMARSSELDVSQYMTFEWKYYTSGSFDRLVRLHYQIQERVRDGYPYK